MWKTKADESYNLPFGESSANVAAIKQKSFILNQKPKLFQF